MIRSVIKFPAWGIALICLLVTAEAVAAPASVSDPPTFDRTEALAVSQAAIGRDVGNYRFRSINGEDVSLARYRGKPLVISLIFTSCHHICPVTTQHLAEVVEKARDVLGDDSFHVVTLGFDAANDTPERMRVFAAEQRVEPRGWDFLSGDQVAVDALAADLGFQYYPSPAGFDHLIQSSILDADGRVFRQVYGIRFDTPHLIEPLKVLVFGERETDSLLDQITARVKLFCTVYDPASDAYRFDYSIFVGLAMGLVLGGLFIYLLLREWSASRRASAG